MFKTPVEIVACIKEFPLEVKADCAIKVQLEACLGQGYKCDVSRQTFSSSIQARLCFLGEDQRGWESGCSNNCKRRRPWSGGNPTSNTYLNQPYTISKFYVQAARLSLYHPLRQPPRLLENLAAFKVLLGWTQLSRHSLYQIAQNLGIAMEGSAEDGMKGVEVLRSTGLPGKVLDQVGSSWKNDCGAAWQLHNHFFSWTPLSIKRDKICEDWGLSILVWCCDKRM